VSLAVIDEMCAGEGMGVELPPMAGYSVRAWLGALRVITSFDPYQLTDSNVVEAAWEMLNGESFIKTLC